jgi:hypothetical protein
MTGQAVGQPILAAATFQAALPVVRVSIYFAEAALALAGCGKTPFRSQNRLTKVRKLLIPRSTWPSEGHPRRGPGPDCPPHKTGGNSAALHWQPAEKAEIGMAANKHERKTNNLPKERKERY